MAMGCKVAFGVATAMFLSAACHAAEPSGSTRRVSNNGELTAALRAAKPGDTILLTPGLYSQVDVSGFKFPAEVRVTSADPNDMAKIQGLRVDQGTSHITFSALDFVGVHTRTGFSAAFGGTDSVRLENSRIHGTKPGDPGGLGIFGSTNFTVTGTEFSNMHTGLTHRDSSNLVISGNRFHHLQSDAVTGTNANKVDIIGNYFTDFYPVTGHIDMIQFFKMGVNTSRDITIADNVFVRGEGAAIQGIFIGNENKIPYEGLKITGNALIGAQFHGISIDTANNAQVTGNLVLGYGGEFAGSWVGIWRSSNAVVSDNVATAFNMWENKGVSEKGNRKVGPAKAGDRSMLAQSRWAGIARPGP